MHELLLGTGFGFFAGIIGILIGGWIGSKKRRQPYLCGAGETEGKTKYKRYDMFAEFAAGLLLAVICLAGCFAPCRAFFWGCCFYCCSGIICR